MLVKYAPPAQGSRSSMRTCETFEARIRMVQDPSSPYNGMVERLQPVAKGSGDLDFEIRVARLYHLAGPSSSFCHVARFLALRAANALFPGNIVDARELRMFRESGVLHAATYSPFVSDDNGVIERRGAAMREFYATEFSDSMAKLRFVEAKDTIERELNPELRFLPRRMKDAGIEPSHPEMNYHLSKGATVFFEIDGIDLGKAATAALDADADDQNGKPAMEAVAAIYALLVHLEARQRIRTQAWYGQTETERDAMRERYETTADTPPSRIYELVFNLVSDTGNSSAIKLPETFIRLGLLQLAAGTEGALLQINQGERMADWGTPAPFPVDPAVIAAMDDEKYEIRKEKREPLYPSGL